MKTLGPIIMVIGVLLVAIGTVGSYFDGKAAEAEADAMIRTGILRTTPTPTIEWIELSDELAVKQPPCSPLISITPHTSLEQFSRLQVIVTDCNKDVWVGQVPLKRAQ